MKMAYLLATLTSGFLVLSSINSAGAHDGEVVFTSSDICAPVNVGKANRNIQNIRGTIANLSTSESIAVSCPLSNIPLNTIMSVAVVAQNDAGTAQEFRCVLREKDPVNLDVQTIIQNLEVGSGSAAVFGFEDITVLGPDTNRFNLTCLLPPTSSLGLLSTASFFD